MNSSTIKGQIINEYKGMTDDASKINNATINSNLKKEKEINTNVFNQQVMNSGVLPVLSKIEKEKNLQDFNKVKNNIGNLSNEINRKLIKKYDRRFYDNYDIINDLDNKIDTQTSIIKINNKNAVKSDAIITSLKSMMTGLVVIVFLFIVFTIVKSKMVLMVGIPIVVIATLIYISYHYRVSSKQNMAQTIKELSEATGRGLVKAAAINLLPPEAYKCPSDCKQKEDKEVKSPFEKSNVIPMTEYNQQTPPNIVGEIPAELGYTVLGPKMSAQNIKSKYIAFASNPYNRPMPPITGLVDYKNLEKKGELEKEENKLATCYSCEWDGPKSDGGSDMIYSHVPCDKHPGYKKEPVSTNVVSIKTCLNKNN